MAEAARILGEKRVCKVEVDAILPVVFFCLEREELQTALRNLSCIVSPFTHPFTLLLTHTHTHSHIQAFLAVL